MSKNKEVREVQIQGKKLTCPICKHDQFWSRETLMNTPGMTFFGVEWLNKAATNYICDSCGYVHWFVTNRK